MYPTSYNIYKKSSAAQFVLLRPRRDDNGRITKTGAVLLEMAPSQGEKSYDWKNSKLTFAFGINDLTQFFDNPNAANWGNFFHQNDGVNKKLIFSPGEGNYAGTFMMTLSSGENRISTPLSQGEFQVLGRLFTAALPRMLGWE
jgi:hypothetical protein